MKDVIQLKITLKSTEPAIWRRLQVEKTTTFFELHHIIQIAFGWKNYHLYEFNSDGHKIGAPDDYMANIHSNDEGVIDARDITLESLIVELGEIFSYLYDFGDSWNHIIIIEKFLPKELAKKYPICMDGALACPPEDCGGIPGFYNLLDILKDKQHPEYKESKRWVGKNFNPSFFDNEKANKTLARLDKYIMNWLNR